MRELHEMAKLAYAQHGDHARTYRAVITVSEEAVFINGHAFSITPSKTGKYTYHFIRVPITTLEEAVGTARIKPTRGGPKR